MAFKHPYLFFGALMFGALSRTAARKQWPTPPWAARLLARWQEREEMPGDEERADNT